MRTLNVLSEFTNTGFYSSALHKFGSHDKQRSQGHVNYTDIKYPGLDARNNYTGLPRLWFALSKFLLYSEMSIVVI